MARPTSTHLRHRPPETDRVDAGQAWSILRAARNAARGGRVGRTGVSLGYTAAGTAGIVSRADGRALVTVEADGRWIAHRDLDGEAETMIDLCLPMALAGPERPLVLGHLGVSLDGCIATEGGQSHYITGPDNILHLHRLRALADAVIVGASTVELDNPRLTTREVEGGNPVRVVIDPACRLRQDLGIFTDNAAETLLFCDADEARAGAARHGCARIVGIPAGPKGLSLDALLAELRARGLHGILVEGGGVTVSRFLEDSKLDRLQLVVAPLITGVGRPGLRLSPLGDLADALRPRCRHVPMGRDMLFDCDLRSNPG